MISGIKIKNKIGGLFNEQNFISRTGYRRTYIFPRGAWREVLSFWYYGLFGKAVSDYQHKNKKQNRRIIQ